MGARSQFLAVMEARMLTVDLLVQVEESLVDEALMSPRQELGCPMILTVMEFREFLRMRRTRGRSHGGRREDDHGGLRGEEDGDWKGGGTHSKPPEWDGEAVPFQDWLIKARLWLATTKVRKKTQGPMILQGLSGVAFQTFKHWAKDVEWLQNEDGGWFCLRP